MYKNPIPKKFDNTRTICFRCTDLWIVPQGYSVKVFNELGLSIIENIFQKFKKAVPFFGTPYIL